MIITIFEKAQKEFIKILFEKLLARFLVLSENHGFFTQHYFGPTHGSKKRCQTS
jgi:hypothetical protein